VNFNGVVDFNDLLEMLKLYFDEDPRTDVRGDRVIDFNDFLVYPNQ
jgi:hypothetical protein